MIVVLLHVLALAFIYNMRVHQFNVPNVFYWADISGDVYLELTPDFALSPGHY